MDLASLVVALSIIALASGVIMFACDTFDDASSHLGRNMPSGVRGATINAVGSSLPELLTSVFFLFVYHERDGFSASIATCAGSAVFNSVIIPAVCVIAVRLYGVSRDGVTTPVNAIEVGRATILRDGAFLLICEGVLVYFLGFTTMTWQMGAGLMLIYVAYFTYLMWQFRKSAAPDDDDEGPEEDPASPENPSLLLAFMTFDFNQMFWGGRPLTNSRAWVNLGCATGIIAGACFALSTAVVDAADALNVPTYFTAVVLAAAATSVPDTVLSVKDALAGNYDDALSNALGSNIFDITIGLGLPLTVFGLLYGGVQMSSDTGNGSNVQELQIALVFVTVVVLVVFISKKTVGITKGGLLMALYLAWMAFVLSRAAGIA